jgi:cytochrome c oxidase cbb3-type subunit I/II
MDCAMTTKLETFRYDDQTARLFFLATIFWAVVGMSMGVIIAALLFLPELNFAPYLTFGRLRPVHTNVVIFAFALNICFAGMYHSMQRLLKTRMWNDFLSKFHFWGWQAIILAAGVVLPLGYTQAKEYAELPWVLDIAIVIVFVAFAINFFMTIIKRREQHLYVAIWFYIASIIAVAALHIGNSLAIPYSWLGSYSLFSGTQDALMQWWYGHNAVAFVLTTPFLGLMYYYMPKAAQRPVFSYRLSIFHFWGLVFIYIWAGPHHLHYTALPSWASTLGMVFSLMLWAPSWGGMINGLFTLRGAWDKLREDPILKFLAVGVTYYGMSTFEGPMMSIKSVNSLSHYTDWTIGHVHAGTLGWNSFIAFGVIYWALPRLYKTNLFSVKLATVHFWVGTIGLLLYQVAMWVAGITQGLMWRAFEPGGRLMYPDFIETVLAIVPLYWVRLLGGTFFLVGMLILVYNIYRTIRMAPANYREEEEHQAPALAVKTAEPKGAVTAPGTYDHALFRLQESVSHGWHRMLESLPITFTVLTVLALSVGTLTEIVPMFMDSRNVKPIASVKPYSPLEVLGRDIYIREGCYLCHSQMVRPFYHETERYGEYSKGGEFVYDHPFQWGSKRTGPDLHRVGQKYPNLWHVRHMEQPTSTTPGSVMPQFTNLYTDDIDTSDMQSKLRALQIIGVPYDEATISHSVDLVHKQANELADAIIKEGGPKDLHDKEILALTAYLQRLGTDIRWVRPVEKPLVIGQSETK